jgi:hypothetical protein
MRVEFCVVRIWLRPRSRTPQKLTDYGPAERQVVLAKCGAGDLVVVPSDSAIGEVLEAFEVQADAQSCAEAYAAKFPGEEFRVVLNADGL